MDKIRCFIKENLVLLAIILICTLTIIVGSISYYKKTHEIHPDFHKLNLDGYDKLMIVAHPDDEILWGGEKLIEDNYVVVCVTCGVVQRRVNEFVKVMNETNDKYIMLGYPDKTNGERDNWDTSYDAITKDIKEIVNLKDWELIVVHNPDGEYGHQHHKMTSAITTKVVENKDILYYFGHYYTKKKISSHYEELIPMKDKTLKEKKRIIGLYRSQRFIQTSFDQMFPYENWLTYNEWNSERNEKA